MKIEFPRFYFLFFTVFFLILLNVIFKTELQGKAEFIQESSIRKKSKNPIDDEEEIPLIFVKKIQKNSKNENGKTISSFMGNKNKNENKNNIENEDENALNVNKIIGGEIPGVSTVLSYSQEKIKKNVQHLNFSYLDSAVDDVVSTRSYIKKL